MDHTRHRLRLKATPLLNPPLQTKPNEAILPTTAPTRAQQAVSVPSPIYSRSRHPAAHHPHPAGVARDKSFVGRDASFLGGLRLDEIEQAAAQLSHPLFHRLEESCEHLTPLPEKRGVLEQGDATLATDEGELARQGRDERVGRRGRGKEGGGCEEGGGGWGLGGGGHRRMLVFEERDGRQGGWVYGCRGRKSPSA